MRLQSVTRVLVSLLLLAGAALITSRAQAQGVRLLSPADGDTVRGAVKIQATKPNPRSGWISYKVEHGGKGDFIIAVVNPFIYRWDTRARDENGKDVYRDGQYTITATALSPQGKKVGEATATVTVKNAISAAARAESVRLNLNYKRHQQVRYQAVGSWEIKPAPDEEEPDDVYELAKDVNGAMVANWREKVMSPTIASGHAVLHIIVGSSGEQMGTEEEVTSLPSAGKVLTYVALRDGVKRLKHEVESCGQPAGPGFEYAELYLQLPDRPLRVGDTWTSQMRILPVPQKDTEIKVVRAKHRVEGFEWMGGHKCLRIRSQFKVDKEKLSLNLRPKTTAGESSVFGGEPGAPPGEADMMGMEAPPMEMGPPGGMGMLGEMGMGMEGAGQAAEELETSYVGDRITYFAYDLNRPVKIIDTITHSVEVERAAAGGMGMEGGMMEGEMMPGFEEMMPPPEAPGMEMPPGEPGAAMGPGGFPGGGMGMQTMKPATPMKIKIHVKLEISEVGL